jgi:hypothetical protein
VSTPERPQHAVRRLVENPFFVLGLAPHATRAEIESARARLLQALARGDAEARWYLTPDGPRPRTADAVERAAVRLADADERVALELWACTPLRSAAAARGDARVTWPGAFAAHGWRSR